MSVLVNKEGQALAGMTPKVESVSVTADGVKTYATLLNELFALVDFSKVTVRTKLYRTADEIFGLALRANQSSLAFSFCYAYTANDTVIGSMFVASSGSKYATYKIGGSFIDRSDSVPTSGEKITIYYD